VARTRVRNGTSIDDVRQVWQPLAEAKTKAIIDKYYAQRSSSGGREGLGIYGKFQERAAREKVRLAVRLLQQARLEVSYTTISKVTGQSRGTISNYWGPPRQPVEAPPAQATDERSLPAIYRLPGA
jgi:DNA invertase Pin-like site-specific DNA recombinase